MAEVHKNGTFYIRQAEPPRCCRRRNHCYVHKTIAVSGQCIKALGP